MPLSPTNSAVAAAIPFRIDEHGVAQVLLITSASGAWIVPKGGVEQGQTEQGAALAEAWEEAGVSGLIVGDPVGRWRTSRKGDAVTAPVYPLLVDRCAARWPEDRRRSRRWVSVRQGVEMVESEDLRDALRRLARQVRTLVGRRAA